MNYEYNDECPASSLRSLSSPVASWNTLPSPPPTPCGQHVTRHISTSSQRSTRQKHLTVFSDCPYIKIQISEKCFFNSPCLKHPQQQKFPHLIYHCKNKQFLNILPNQIYVLEAYLLSKKALQPVVRGINLFCQLTGMLSNVELGCNIKGRWLNGWRGGYS